MSYGNQPYGTTPYKYEDPEKNSSVVGVENVDEIEDPNSGIDLMFGLDDNDLSVVKGDLVIVSGTRLIKQRIKDSLQSILGDYLYDLSNGLPWIDIIQKKYTMSEVNLLIKSTIMAQPQVTSIISFESTFDRESGELTMNIAMQTTYGELKLSLTK